MKTLSQTSCRSLGFQFLGAMANHRFSLSRQHSLASFFINVIINFLSALIMSVQWGQPQIGSTRHHFQRPRNISKLHKCTLFDMNCTYSSTQLPFCGISGVVLTNTMLQAQGKLGGKRMVGSKSHNSPDFTKISILPEPPRCTCEWMNAFELNYSASW